jgi:hypothetical protein
MLETFFTAENPKKLQLLQATAMFSSMTRATKLRRFFDKINLKHAYSKLPPTTKQQNLAFTSVSKISGFWALFLKYQ